MQNYYDFEESLKKEGNVEARENLNRLYQVIAPNYHLQMIDYDAGYGNYLQLSGVDAILHSTNKYGTPINQVWIQEKITFSKYKNLLFEYEKASGAKGWAVANEKCDWLVYYQDGDVYLMKFIQVRAYIIKNLARLKANGYVKTDNHNVKVSIQELEENIQILKYEAESY